MEGEAEHTDEADLGDELSKFLDAVEEEHGAGTSVGRLNTAELDKGKPVEATEGIFFFNVFCCPRRSVCVSASAFPGL
jgi:hypothetical protein